VVFSAYGVIKKESIQTLFLLRLSTIHMYESAGNNVHDLET